MSNSNVPDALQQELRNLVALHCREVLMSTKSDGLKKDAQVLVLEKVFHGSAGYSSALDAMLEGKGFYASLFQKLDLEINRAGNDSRKEGFMLELLPIFHLNTSESSSCFLPVLCCLFASNKVVRLPPPTRCTVHGT